MITLRSVGCLIDENDVYLNIQAYTDPFIINYDVNDEKSWSKFLGEGDKRTYFFPNNIITTIQKPLLYDYTPDIFA